MNAWLLVVLFTLIPTLELRASIPLGIELGLSWLLVLLVAVVVNVLLGVFVFWVIDHVFLICKKIVFLKKFVEGYERRVLRRARKGVERYGVFALAAFVGVPLPGSGVYTGAVAARLLGMSWRRYFWGMVVGVLIAGVLVTTVWLLGKQGLLLL